MSKPFPAMDLGKRSALVRGCPPSFELAGLAHKGSVVTSRKLTPYTCEEFYWRACVLAAPELTMAKDYNFLSRISMWHRFERDSGLGNLACACRGR